MTPTENGALTVKGFSVGLSLRPIPVEGLPEFGQTHVATSSLCQLGCMNGGNRQRMRLFLH